MTRRQIDTAHWSEVPEEERESALGPVDPEALAHAADELRQRTMSLEEGRGLPSGRLVVALLFGIFAVAALILVFRTDLRALLKWMGL